MATINFYYRGKSEKGKLTLRFKHSTEIDYRASTKIVSLKKYWFKTNGKHRKLSELTYLDAYAKDHKNFLENVKENLLVRFNTDYNNGIAVSKEWLLRNLDEVTNILSSKEEINHTQKKEDQKQHDKLLKEREIYNKNLLTSSLQKVIESEYFDNKNLIHKYSLTIKKVMAYQTTRKVEIKTKDVNQNFINDFTAFLVNDLKHQYSTANAHCKGIVHAVKYQKNAYPDEVQMSSSFFQIKYKKQSKSETKSRRSEIVITLSFSELDQIHNTELPERLLNAKKAILFGCEVGLRVSDYNKLTKENLKESNGLKYWSFWNQKTGEYVVIPINERLQLFIDCYGMPKTDYKKTDDVILNREIKEVCKLSGINESIQARKSIDMDIKGQKTRRTVSMKFPKHEVISTHSLRRSFATNYYNILTPYEIRQITGHTTDAQLFEYINQDKDKSELIENMAMKMNKAEKPKMAKLKILKTVNN